MKQIIRALALPLLLITVGLLTSGLAGAQEACHECEDLSPACYEDARFAYLDCEEAAWGWYYDNGCDEPEGECDAAIETFLQDCRDWRETDELACDQEEQACFSTCIECEYGE